MIDVFFHRVTEFLDELRRDHDLIERGIVRTTVRTEMNRIMVTKVSVISAAIVSNRLVQLELSCGDGFVHDGIPDQRLETARKRAEDATVRIEEFCKEHGLDSRAGRFKTVPAQQ